MLKIRTLRYWAHVAENMYGGYVLEVQNGADLFCHEES